MLSGHGVMKIRREVKAVGKGGVRKRRGEKEEG